MPELSASTYALMFLGIIIVLIFLWLGWRLRLAWNNFLFSLVRRKGKIGEKDAIKLLKENGYRIVQSQFPLAGVCIVDDESVEFNVRVDFLVERNGIRYLAEVKTGGAANPKTVSTRRQLFEYSALGHFETVLLVDATKKKVMEIGFRQTKNTSE